MYFVVPKDRSIIKSVGNFDGMWNATAFADKLRAETGEHYDVIQMTRVHTTQTMAERLEQDMVEKAVAA